MSLSRRSACIRRTLFSQNLFGGKPSLDHARQTGLLNKTPFVTRDAASIDMMHPRPIAWNSPNDLYANTVSSRFASC